MIASKYEYISPNFAGKLIFGFDTNQNLTLFQNEAFLNTAQLNWLLGNLPTNFQALLTLIHGKDGKLVELSEAATFERFWDEYAHKINRKRCEPLFNKLSDADKVLAITSVKAYKLYLKRMGRYQADPETYLRKTYYETEWHKQN